MLSVFLLGVCKISIRNVIDSEVGLTINKALRLGRVRVLGMSLLQHILEEKYYEQTRY